MSVHKDVTRDIARIFLHIYRRSIRLAREAGIRMVVAEAGENLKVFGRVRIDMPQKIYIGDDCTLNEGVLIVGRDDVRIGNGVTLSAYVVVTSASMESGQVRRHSQAPVTIGDNVWVAASASTNTSSTRFFTAHQAQRVFQLLARLVPHRYDQTYGPARIAGLIGRTGLPAIPA